jgi:hypothetical protein
MEGAMREIVVYAWGDPTEKETRTWYERAKIAGVLLLGMIAGYLWAYLLWVYLLVHNGCGRGG